MRGLEPQAASARISAYAFTTAASSAQLRTETLSIGSGNGFLVREGCIGAYLAQESPSIHGMLVQGFTRCRFSPRDARRGLTASQDEHSSIL